MYQYKTNMYSYNVETLAVCHKYISTFTSAWTSNWEYIPNFVLICPCSREVLHCSIFYSLPIPLELSWGLNFKHRKMSRTSTPTFVAILQSAGEFIILQTKYQMGELNQSRLSQQIQKDGRCFQNQLWLLFFAFSFHISEWVHWGWSKKLHRIVSLLICLQECSNNEHHPSFRHKQFAKQIAPCHLPYILPSPLENRLSSGSDFKCRLMLWTFMPNSFQYLGLQGRYYITSSLWKQRLFKFAT